MKQKQHDSPNTMRQDERHDKRNCKKHDKRHNKQHRERMIYLSIAAGTALLNVIAWNSAAFCDAYVAYLFPVWVNTYGRFTGLFPFSVGEWLIVAGVVLVVLAALCGLVWVGMCIGRLWQKTICRRKLQVPEEKQSTAGDKRISPGGNSPLSKIIKGYYHFFIWVVLLVCVIMTLNCTILYHASTFSQKYFDADAKEYTIEDVICVYNDVASHCNELSGKVERDADGTILYQGVNAAGEEADMEEKAIEAMQQLGKTYAQLDGYYPRPKPMMFSDFMCQQYMCGYYFPFSMEANYNDVMYIMNKPATMCHELAHLRGFIYEDEANFIAFLACVGSDDVTFQYAGYLSVLNYLINDLYQARQTQPELYQAAVSNVEPVGVYEIVVQDNVFVTDEEWERINGKALIDTETVDEVSDAFTDTTLKLNGVSDGMVSYSRVVQLLLAWYEQ